MAGVRDPKAEAVPKGRNIILLSDGTGNSAGKSNKTNVWRLYQALDLSNGRQIALYDDGVGTSGFRPLQLLGGAFGWGLSRNVRDLYRFLCQHYQTGDHIYIFGFSRGAFTARTVADLIGKCGILDPAKAVPRSGLFRHEDVQLNTDEGLGAGVKLAYQSYRRSYWAPVAWLLRRIRDFILQPIPKPPAFRRDFSREEATEVEFVGVWDTVNAVGLPIDELSTMIDGIFYPHRFPDQNLSPKVKRACHAIAIDDERQTFHPVLWNEKKEPDLVEQKEVAEDRIKQVWFVGMHSNVGGGYPDDGLACVSLQWMINEVKRNGRDEGLDFNEEKVTEIAHRAQPLGKMYDSRAGLGVYYRYKPRRIDQLCSDPENEGFVVAPKIHHSVFDRIVNDTASYAPTGIPLSYSVVDQDGVVSETAAGSVERSKLLERAQSHIFWRRFLYFMLLLVTVALLLLPHYLPPVPGRDPTNGLQMVLGSFFGLISPFLPGFLTYWIDGWTQSAVWFSILVVLYGALIWHRRTIAANTQRLAEVAWWDVKDGKKGSGSKPDVPAGRFEKIADSLRHSTTMRCIHDWSTRRAMPWVALALMVCVTAGIGYRLFVHWPTVGGGECSKWISEQPPKDDAGTIEFGQTFSFDTKMPCLATGLMLYAGQKYTVKFAMGDAWSDGGFAADQGGLSHPLSRFHPVFAAANPMRRKLSYPWLTLTGQIGLHPRNTFPIPAAEMTFRSQATGQLYLYVNDAINGLGIEVPETGSSNWDAFYLNNEGTAQITVTPG